MALLSATLVCGCATELPEDMPGVLEYGEQAEAVTDARIVSVREEMALLERQKEDAMDQRSKLLGDAKNYRKLSSEAWTDTRLTDRQRGPESRQYLQLAQNLEAEADAYMERIKSIESRISALESQRHNLLRRRQVLEGVEAPAE
jgi:proline dehydrogenase